MCSRARFHKCARGSMDCLRTTLPPVWLVKRCVEVASMAAQLCKLLAGSVHKVHEWQHKKSSRGLFGRKRTCCEKLLTIAVHPFFFLLLLFSLLSYFFVISRDSIATILYQGKSTCVSIFLLDICYYAFNFTPHRLTYTKSNGLSPFYITE